MDLLYSQLSYRIVGILFHVHNELAGGYLEKHVQRAVAAAFKKEDILFREQVMTSLVFDDSSVGRYFFDFVVEEKIVLELKIASKIYKKDFDQVKNYLLRSGLLLGILACFNSSGVKVYRVLRPTN